MEWMLFLQSLFCFGFKVTGFGLENLSFEQWFFQRKRGMMLPCWLTQIFSPLWSTMLYPQLANRCAYTETFKGKSHGTVQRDRPDSANGSIQWFYVECAYVRRVVVWRHCWVFQVYRLQNLKIGLSSIGNLYVVCALKKCVNLPLRKFNFKFFRAGSSHTGGILLLNNFKSSFHKLLTKNLALKSVKGS